MRDSGNDDFIDDLPIPNDEYLIWTIAKFSSRCAECESEIQEGDQILFDTRDSAPYCTDCGEDVQYCL